jgi:protein ImuA
MPESKSDIIARLRKEILPLETFKAVLNTSDIDIKLGALKNAFHNNTFPLGVIHEFVAAKPEDIAATSGFIAGILPSLMRENGITIWIGGSRTIFPPALQSFGIAPDKIIFIDLQKEKEILWAMEEALKCNGLAAVIGEVKELSFTASRRLQLAVEQSHVTGFVLRLNPKNLNTNACFTRWQITSLPSGDHLPGVGFPRWQAELLKVRNGKPCTLQIEFTGGRFRSVYKMASITQQQQKKTG